MCTIISGFSCEGVGGPRKDALLKLLKVTAPTPQWSKCQDASSFLLRLGCCYPSSSPFSFPSLRLLLAGHSCHVGFTWSRVCSDLTRRKQEKKYKRNKIMNPLEPRILYTGA